MVGYLVLFKHVVVFLMHLTNDMGGNLLLCRTDAFYETQKALWPNPLYNVFIHNSLRWQDDRDNCILDNYSLWKDFIFSASAVYEFYH